MRQFFAAIAAFLRAMPKFVLERVRVGGKWVQRLIATFEPATPPLPAPMPEAPVDDFAPLRNVAGKLVQGYEPGALDEQSLPSQQLAWLRAMTREELCKLLLSDDPSIKMHLRGIERIKGLIPFELDAIRDVARARAQRPKPKPARRTLRAVLAELEGAPIL